MYKGQSVALVIPAYNEERLIKPTLAEVPEAIDRIYVVDDASTDNMPCVVQACASQDDRIVLVRHDKNMGPGKGVITGYLRASADNYDLAVVIGGDWQMDLADLPSFLDPLINGKSDYTKGNRFMMDGNAFADMPRSRLIGNTLISLLTKVASGYFKVFDAVDGYTAITKEAIDRVNWDKAWGGYGYPMDFLVQLNIRGLRVMDVPRRAIYREGERQSQIKPVRYTLRVSPLLLRGFLRRLWQKHVLSDFHPLVFLYAIGVMFTPLGLVLGLGLILSRLVGPGVSGATAIATATFLNIGFQSLFFAMMFDMQEGL